MRLTAIVMIVLAWPSVSAELSLAEIGGAAREQQISAREGGKPVDQIENSVVGIFGYSGFNRRQVLFANQMPRFEVFKRG